jgi:hypothetical protein
MQVISINGKLYEVPTRRVEAMEWYIVNDKAEYRAILRDIIRDNKPTVIEKFNWKGKLKTKKL